MKIRSGFVSNSSSSSFILDGRDPEVCELLTHVVAKPIDGIGRQTTCLRGHEAVEFANDLITCGWGAEHLGAIIVKYADEFGEENIVFLRESDEGMDGFLFDEDEESPQVDYMGYKWAINIENTPNEFLKYQKLYEKLDRLAVYECEYH